MRLITLEHQPDAPTMFQPCCNDAEIMLYIRQQFSM